MSARVRGVISDLNGHEFALYAASTVLVDGADEYVVPATAWTDDDRLPLADADRPYVRAIDGDAGPAVSTGEVVLLAGPRLVRAVDANEHALRSLKLELASWQSTVHGYRWRVGTVGLLAELKTSASRIVREQLHRLLFDPLEKRSTGDAQRIFELYRALDTTDSRERLVTVGLFHHEMRSESKYRLTRARAGAGRHFDDADAFDREVQRAHDWLASERLSDERARALVEPPTRERIPADSAAGGIGAIDMTWSTRLLIKHFAENVPEGAQSESYDIQDLAKLLSRAVHTEAFDFTQEDATT